MAVASGTHSSGFFGEDRVKLPNGEYGQRYILDLLIAGEGRTATVRSTWIIRADEDFPRLTSCYVL